MKQISLGTNDIGRYCPSQKILPAVRPEVREDWGLEKKFALPIKAILGTYFIVQDIVIDMTQGGDFLILNTKSVKVGARLRRGVFYSWVPKRMTSTITHKKYTAYPREEFTIRYKRPSGVPTEIDKILKGYVDYFFFGFVDKKEEKIIQWFLGDLNIFRTIDPQPIDRRENHNPKDSEFNVYKLKNFPETFVSASLNLP